MNKILLLEDDLSLIRGLSFALKKEGFALDVARTIKEAAEIWADKKYDLLILDVALPDGSGFEMCKKVRQESKVPIIFLTASDEEISVIIGLDIGGDDYITKPFKLGVLMSRMNSLLRRAKDFNTADTVLHSNGIEVVLLKGQAFKNKEPLDLTAAEYKLLCLFMQTPNAILSGEQMECHRVRCEMKLFTDKAIKQFFIALCTVISISVLLSQLIIWTVYQRIAPLLLILSLLAAIGILTLCFHYFSTQNERIEKAAQQMKLYLAGDIGARIACDDEGELYKLFHEVNTLVAVLNAHAENELQAKEFLKSTLADVSHQLKTPLAALNIYNGLLHSEGNTLPEIKIFALLSEKELDRIETLVQNCLKSQNWTQGL